MPLKCVEDEPGFQSNDNHVGARGGQHYNNCLVGANGPCAIEISSAWAGKM